MNTSKPQKPSSKRWRMSRTISLCIPICALTFCGCARWWTGSTPSACEVVAAQEAILDAGPLVCRDGATVQPLGAQAGQTYRFTGRVYILPEAAYKALMLSK